MGWLLLVAVVLAVLGLWLLRWSAMARRESGLPVGRITYVDTGALERCERPLFSDRYRLTGRPDYLVQSSRGTIPVEVKSGTAPNQPYDAHILQLAAYCLLVEEQEGTTPPHGVLKYDDRAFEVDYTPGMRAHLLETLGAMRAGLQSWMVDRSHEDPGRCRGCGYRDRCEERLA
jgi:CRISPR-associated exonuclease Cas4